jgi:hypothetical protein
MKKSPSDRAGPRLRLRLRKPGRVMPAQTGYMIRASARPLPANPARTTIVDVLEQRLNVVGYDDARSAVPFGMALIA